MQKKTTFWLARVAGLGVMLALGQSASAGIEVVAGTVKQGAGDPWTYDASGWSVPIYNDGGLVSATGPGWFSQEPLFGTSAEADINLTPPGPYEWTKYLEAPGTDPGQVTLAELIYFNSSTVPGAPPIIGWSMESQTAGWEFVDTTGLAGLGSFNGLNDDGSAGVRGGGGTGNIYDYAFDSAQAPGVGIHFRLAVDLVWTGAGLPTTDIQILQTACLEGSTLPCTGSTPPPPPPGAPIPATSALLVIGLVGMGMRRRRS